MCDNYFVNIVTLCVGMIPTLCVSNECFEKIRDDVNHDLPFRVTAVMNKLKDLSSVSVEERTKAIIDQEKSSYAAMLVLMKCFDDASSDVKDQIREIAMNIMLNSTLESIPSCQPNVDNVNTFCSKMWNVTDVAGIEKSLKYLDLLRDDTQSNNVKFAETLVEARRRGEGPIKDYDKFECSALFIIKVFSANLLESNKENDWVRTVNDKIQNAKVLPDVGAIQIDNEEMALACKPIIQVANLFFDAAYNNHYLDLLDSASAGDYGYYFMRPQQMQYRDIFEEDGGALFRVQCNGAQARVIFPLRLDLCGKYAGRRQRPAATWYEFGGDGDGYRWKPHVSTYPSAAARVLRTIAPYVDFTGNMHLKLTPNNGRTRSLYLTTLYSNGNDQITQYGKWLTFYPNDEAEFVSMVKNLSNALNDAVKNGVLDADRDFVPLVGDARVGSKGGVFIRDQNTVVERDANSNLYKIAEDPKLGKECRGFPNFGEIPFDFADLGGLFWRGQPYTTGFDQYTEKHKNAPGSGSNEYSQTPEEIENEIQGLKQPASQSSEQWLEFTRRFNDYRLRTGLMSSVASEK
ncbi:MAG: hypothetical protein LBQ43_00400 [Holosporales bacterium]|jgi:hypothetical protein|nr:hypothetical protein [Holosporales bacterium]